MKLIRVIPSVVLCFLLLMGSVSVLADVPSDADIVARVNGKAITQAEFFEALQREAGAFILSQMILDELIYQKQAELDVYVSDEELTEVLIDVVNQLGGLEGLQMFLMQNRLSEDQLIEQIEWNLLISKLAMAEVIVSEEEKLEFFASNRSLFDAVEASHILVNNEEEASSLLSKVNAGDEFSALAKEHSKDPGSGSLGGTLGYFRRGMMVPSFEDMAFSLAIGETGLVESDFGWHIILVTGRQVAEYEQVESEVTSYLQEIKAVSPTVYIDQLTESAQIEIIPQRYRNLLAF